MFEHSVKVPRHYKIAANIFKKVATEGGSVKTLLYDDKLRHFRTNVLYALITETIKHAADIDRIFTNSSILQKEPRLDPWLAKVLTAELLFGKKQLPGKSKPVNTILSYQEQFKKYTTEHGELVKTEVHRPRYVRINTNVLTTSDAVRAFQDEEYRFIRCTSGSYNDYLDQIRNLSEYDFMQDYHVKTIFVFARGTKMYEHALYLENKIILQDKATAMAVHLLAPPAGSIILDMCAAPGIKTTQAAAYMRNQGKIYAVERNEKRYNTLCDFIKKTGSSCVEAIHKDALEIKRGDYEDVEYILLDPSCSGSGMELCIHNYVDDTRLAKLTSLQEKFLKHAMNAFPKAKRIVYSTCSLFPEENERVITNVVKTSRAKWRVQDVKELLKGQWNNFGSGMYGSIGTRCLYAKPDSDLTTGFFLAVLDRDEKELDKEYTKNALKSDITEQTEKIYKPSINEVQLDLKETVMNNDTKVKKKKKKSLHIQGELTSNTIDEITNQCKEDKKMRKRERHLVIDGNQVNELFPEEPTVKKKKKKSISKDFSEVSSGVISVNEQERAINNKIELPQKKKKKQKQDKEKS